MLANATGAFAPYAERLRAGPAQGELAQSPPRLAQSAPHLAQSPPPSFSFCAGVPILSTVLAASEGLMGVALEPGKGKT